MADSQPQSSGYKPIFGTNSKDGSKKPVPKWVPVTLLAISTAAMVVPIVLLRRHRAASRQTLANAPPPPPRRTTSLKGTPIANPASTPSAFSMRDSAPVSPMSSSSSNAAAKSGDNFNGALHCAKAFGTATLIVGVGAFASVWGVRQYMGVETTQEFADRMRLAILTRMPVLSSRIHRPPAPEDGDAIIPLEVSNAAPSSATDLNETWNWSDAERRLKEAFDEHGFYGWVAAAMRELEAEGRIERTKRGHV